MKRFLALPLLLALAFSVAAQAQSPIGTWRTIDDETNTERSHVQIFEQDGKLYGKIVKLSDRAICDMHPSAMYERPSEEEGERPLNECMARVRQTAETEGADYVTTCETCEGDYEDKNLVGAMILKGLEPDGDEWNDGTITDPKNGKTYAAILSMNGNDKLDVRGFIKVPLLGSTLGRTQSWERVK